MPYFVSEFDYVLPPELIAQAPLAERSASRLLHVRQQALDDRHFRDLPELLSPGDLLVMNDSRVLHARLFGRKETGGEVEVLIERPLGEREALAMVRASKSPKPGSRLRLADAFDVEVLGRSGEEIQMRELDEDFFRAAEELGIDLSRPERGTDEDDARRAAERAGRF